MMKRWFILLALLLLLTGCSDTPTEPTTTETQPEETQPQIQEEALMQWDLPGAGLHLLGAMGEDLVFYDGCQIMLISADGKQILAAAVLENLRTAEENDIHVGETGVAFYDRQNQWICFLDENLEKTSYLELQGGVQGSILLTEDWSRIYYCTSQGVHSLDLHTGIRRTIAYRKESWLGVSAVFMENLISCNVQQEDGTVGTLIIDANTGTTVWETGKVSHLSTYSNLYFCKMTSDGVEEWVFGWGADQPRNFWPPEDAQILPLLDGDKVVTIEDGSLRCYDLRKGKCISRIPFENADQVQKLVYLKNRIYFTDGENLFSWNPKLAVLNDEASYISMRYTKDDPDEAGLQERIVTTKVMEKLYSVSIHIWNDAEKLAPKGYEFSQEYIPEEYDEALKALENALDTFGRNILKDIGNWKAETALHIVLVRQIRRGTQILPGMQYVLNDEVYIALPLNGDLEENFYHFLGHAVDTVVLRESLAFDDWEWLNPEEFVYMSDPDADPKHDYAQYLEEDNRWFIDENSMQFQVEDRATILTYAIMPDNEAYFQGEAMQAKLRMLCRGIRETFELTGERYIWEQYLNEEEK